MLATSSAFAEAFKASIRDIKVRITMKDIIYYNDDVFSVSYNGGSIVGETFAIGSTFSNSIKVTFDHIIEGIKKLDEIKLEFGILLPDKTIEYVLMGVFLVDKYDPQRNDNRTVIDATDRMVLLEAPYETELTYPARIKDVALEIANKTGLYINETSFGRLSNEEIIKPQGNNITFRQVLGWVAQFEWGFVTFDRDGLLDIRRLNDPEFTVKPSAYFLKGLTKDETLYSYKGINCKVTTFEGENSSTATLSSGIATGAQVTLENNCMTQFLLDNIQQQLRGTNYYPFSLNWRGNPALEAGDWITVTDTKGKVYKVPNLSYSLNFSGGLSATSSANTATVSETTYQYQGPLTQQLEEIRGQLGAAGNHIYRETDEPLYPKEGDLWFKPNGPDTEIRIYHGGEWVLEVSTAKNRELEEMVTEIEKEIEQAQKDVSAAITTANSANAKASQAAKDVAIANNTASNAQQLATNALSGAANAVSTANNSNTTANNAVALANTAKTDASKAIADAQKVASDLSSLSIGGRNYFKNSAKQVSGTAKSSGKEFINSINWNMAPLIDKYGLDQYYTVSFDIKAEKAGVMRAYAQNGNGTKYSIGMHVFDVTTEFKRFSYTFKPVISLVGEIYAMLAFYGIYDSGIIPTAENIKFELGNKATDWSPAPEDIQIQVDKTNEQLSTKVSQVSFDQLNNAVTKQATEITQTKSDVALKADKTTVNTLTGKVESNAAAVTVANDKITNLVTKTDCQTTQIAKLEQTATGLTSSVSKVQSDFDNLSIGGRNYLLNSKNPANYWWGVSCGDAGSVAKSLAVIDGKQVAQFEVKTVSAKWEVMEYTWGGLTVNGCVAGERWALSGSVYANKDLKLNCSVRHGDGTNVSIDFGGVALKAGWNTLTISGVATSAYSPKREVYMTSNERSVGTIVAFEWLKLEKGNKPTDWSPAPEDLATQVELSEIKQTADKITATVANKAEQSQVTQMAGQITSVVTDLGKINTDSANFLKGTSTTPVTVTRNWNYLIIRPLSLGWYTYTFYAKASVAGRVNVYLNDDSGQERIQRTWPNPISLTTEYQKFALSFQVTKAPDAINSIVMRAYSNADATMQITGHSAMLSRGVDAKTWQPAPEETATQATVSEIKQTADKLAVTVSNKAEQSQVTQIAGQISATSSKVDMHTTQIANLQVDYASVSSTVAKVEKGLDDLSIGGRNYLLKTAKPFVMEGRNIVNQNITAYLFSFGKISDCGFKIGDKVVLSFDYATTEDSVGQMFCQFAGTPWGLGSGTSPINLGTNKAGKVSYTATVRAEWLAGQALGLAIRADMFVGTLTISNFKFEVGNKPTDWSPAPEDMATQTDYSNLTQRVDSVQSTVATKANQSQVTQLSGQVSSVVTGLNTSNVFPDYDFSKKVLPSGLENVAYDYTSGVGLRIVNSSAVEGRVYWDGLLQANKGYRISFEAAVFPKVTTVVFGQGSNPNDFYAAITESLKSYSGEFTTSNTNAFSIYVPANTVVRITNLKIEMVTTQTQITQLTDSINLKVSKNDVVNQINVSTEGILIAGNKVRITGQTMIDSAVIATAHIKDAAITDAKIATLSADKINAGTLNAANVNVINLNADNLVSGTIDANRITVKNLNATSIVAGTIDASKIAVINLNANNITSGTISADKISGGTIDANKITVTNLNATNITSGTLSASKISGGTINGNNVTITNLNASNITSGTISTARFNINTLSALSANLGTVTAGTLSGSNFNLNLSSGSLRIGGSSTYLSFTNNGTFTSTNGYTTATIDGNYLRVYNSGSYSTWVYPYQISMTSGSNSVALRPNNDTLSLTSGSSSVVGFDINAGSYGRLNMRYDTGWGHVIQATDSGSTTGRLTLRGREVATQSDTSLYVRNRSNSGWQSVQAASFSSASAYSLKTNFEAITTERMLAAIVNTDIVKYRYKSDLAQEFIGFVINDTGTSPYKIDRLLVNNDNESFSSTTAVGILIGSVQELNKKILDLENEIKKLKGAV